MKFIIGITGASGAIYGVRLLEVLSAKQIETHLIISASGKRCIEYETGRKVADIEKMATFSYDIDAIDARLASGSFRHDGMIIAPCTIKTMSSLAGCYSNNLLTRAGDVTLKEKRRLVLLVRETPFHLGHLANMQRLAEMGAVIMPPVPAFYHRPKTIEDIIDHTIGKVLDIFNIDNDLFRRWRAEE